VIRNHLVLALGKVTLGRKGSRLTQSVDYPQIRQLCRSRPL
jgi:hypothetical protein